MTAIPQAYVIGHPIAHSRSPMLHGYWLARYGIAGRYDLLDVAPEAIPAFIGRFRAERLVGANVTVPHKTAVMGLLDRIDPAARAMGAVNTLYWDGDILAGDNADAIGFMRNLDDRAPGWDDGASRAVVLGAGGAARAAAFGLAERGLSVAVFNRSFEKAEALARHIGPAVSACPGEAMADHMAEADLLVNATSLGMVHQPNLAIDLTPLRRAATVCDVVYVPLETDLIRTAASRGHRTVDGLGMLLHQAVVGFSRWFGQVPEVTEDLRTLIENDIRASSH